MLQVFQLSKSYGALKVLGRVSFSVGAGERVALLGANGSGKSTLLRCMAGLDTLDGGSVVVGSGARIGYLAQEPLDPAQTVASVLDGTSGDARLAAAAAWIAERPADTNTIAAYEQALAELEASSVSGREAISADVMRALRVDALAPAARIGELSGGERTRLALAALTASAHDVLLLDEPTNHLDADAVAWLETYLRAFAGAVLMVSHDRAFLDRVAHAILYLDAETRTIRRYPGGYSAFTAARRAESEQAGRAWREQEAYVARVQRDITRLKSQARSIETSTTPRQPGVRVYAKKKARVARSRERKLERFLGSDERVEKPRQGWGLDLDFGDAGSVGREAIRMERVGFAYPGRAPLLGNVTLEVRQRERVALTGPNGAGKTTLLRLVLGDLEPTEGTLWVSPGVRAGYLSQAQEGLDPAATVLESVRRTRPMEEGAARDFLHHFLFPGDSVHRLVSQCSPGERARLALALVVLRQRNLLLLDEPLNHLDVESREHFEAALASFDGGIVAVSHDEAFTSRFAARVFDVRDGRVTEVQRLRGPSAPGT